MISTLRPCMTACTIGTIEEVRNDCKRSGSSNFRYSLKRLLNRSDQMLRRPGPTGRENGAVILWNNVWCDPHTVPEGCPNVSISRTRLLRQPQRAE